jgi:hypothetical protein
VQQGQQQGGADGLAGVAQQLCSWEWLQQVLPAVQVRWSWTDRVRQAQGAGCRRHSDALAACFVTCRMLLLNGMPKASCQVARYQRVQVRLLCTLASPCCAVLGLFLCQLTCMCSVLPCCV